jgi:hypothetical protein
VVRSKLTDIDNHNPPLGSNARKPTTNGASLVCPTFALEKRLGKGAGFGPFAAACFVLRQSGL